MRRHHFHRLALASAVALLAAAGDTGLGAQSASLGTFRWQLQPFCNAVTVTVTQVAGQFTVDGADDQCGAPQRAPLVGVATVNPDGSVGFGLHVVTVPGGRGVHVEARVDLGTLSGAWTDSAGNRGAFVFNGAGSGQPRPEPTLPGSLIAPGSISAAHLAPGVIGAVAQARVTGVCPPGQAFRGVNGDGSVACTDAASIVDRGVPSRAPGFLPSMAIGADGRPVLSHSDSTRRVIVTVCASGNCTRTGFTTSSIGDTRAGRAAVAIGTDGLPIVAYAGDPVGLRVTHCGDPRCTSNNITTPVSLEGGGDPSLAIGSDGLPVISHSGGGMLLVTRCADLACTSGGTATADDGGTSVGGGSTIAVGNDGLPIIAHRDATASALRVTHCGNLACSANNASTTVLDVANVVGRDARLAIGGDGLPLIAHRDVTAGTVLVTHCVNARCSRGPTGLAATTAVLVERPGAVQGLGMAIGRDGLPLLVYPDEAFVAPRVTHCGNATCTAGNVTGVLDAGPDTSGGNDPTVAIGSQGLPLVAHRDARDLALRVVSCGTVTCQ